MIRSSLILLTVAVLLGVATIGSVNAATVRGHGVSGGHHGHGGHGHHVGYYPYYGYGYYGYGHYGHYGPYFGFRYYAPVYPYYGYYAPRPLGPPAATIDTDVRPEKADVFLDGEYIGSADDYDGFPRYLTVRPGEHTIVFKAEGRITYVRTFKARAGELIPFDFKMQKGEDTPEMAAYVGPERRTPLVAEPGTAVTEATPRGTVRLDTEEPTGEGDVAAGEAGFVRLRISPPDASVYLDGGFYGSAKHLSGLHGDLRLESGRHVIEVVRPGFRSVRRTLDLLPGDRVELTFGLEREESPGKGDGDEL